MDGVDVLLGTTGLGAMVALVLGALKVFAPWALQRRRVEVETGAKAWEQAQAQIADMGRWLDQVRDDARQLSKDLADCQQDLLAARARVREQENRVRLLEHQMLTVQAELASERAGRARDAAALAQARQREEQLQEQLTAISRSNGFPG